MTFPQKELGGQRRRTVPLAHAARRTLGVGPWVAVRAGALALGTAAVTTVTAASVSAQTEAPSPEHDAEQLAPPGAEASASEASPEPDATLDASPEPDANPEATESVPSPPQEDRPAGPEVRVFHPRPADEPLRTAQASPASETAAPEPEEAAPKLQFFPVNIGLASPVEIIPKASTRRFGVHMGALYGDIGASGGFHINGLVGRVRQDTVGFGASGLWTDVSGNTRGYEAAGLVHRIGGSLAGAQTAGLVAMSGDTDGLQAGGILSTAGDLKGSQMGGVLTRARQMDGAQFGGIATFAADVRGTQIAGIVARADAFEGAQIAGIANLAGELKGVQIGLVNHTLGSVRGAQIGLVNIAKEVDGAQVGLVNLAGNTRYQAVVWTDEQVVPQAGWRTSWGPLYSQVGFGINPRGFESTNDDKKELVPSYALGGRVPLGAFFLDLDAMYSVEVSGNRRHHGEPVAHAIRQRVAAGYQVVDWLALTAGVGIRQRSNPDGVFELGPTVFGGVQMF